MRRSASILFYVLLVLLALSIAVVEGMGKLFTRDGTLVAEMDPRFEGIAKQYWKVAYTSKNLPIAMVASRNMEPGKGRIAFFRLAATQAAEEGRPEAKAININELVEGLQLTPEQAEKFHFGTLAFDYKYVDLNSPLSEIEKRLEEEIRYAKDAGAIWIRPHLTAAFNLGFIESDGKYDWSIPDLVIKTLQAHGMQVLIQFWNSPGKAKPFCNLYMDEEEVEAYRNWLRAMVERYDGDGVDDMPGLLYPVLYYEVLNEPIQHNPEEEAKKYVEILKISYETIKQANPNAKVLVGGFLVAGRDLELVLENGGADFFDIINWHGEIEGRIMYEIAEKYGAGDKGMWITEIGFFLISNKYQRGEHITLEDEREQARWLAETYVRLFSEGVDKIFHIEILGNRDIAEGTRKIPVEQEGTCLYPEDEGRPRLAYFTHKLLAYKIGCFDSVEKIGEQVYEFTVSSKKYWVAGGRGSVKIRVEAPYVRVINLVPLNKEGDFETYILEARNGEVEVELEEGPVLLEELGEAPETRPRENVVFKPKAPISVESPEEIPRIFVERNFTLNINVAEPDVPIKLSIGYSHVTGINIKLRNTVRGVVVYFEELDEKPPSIPTPPGLVYAYHEISVNVPEDSIERGEITFWVLERWLSENNMSEKCVVMLRYYGGEWLELPTELVDRNATHLTFTAETSGFSVFATVARKISTNVTIAVEPKEVAVGEEVALSGSITPPMEASITLSIAKPDGTTSTQTTVSSSNGVFVFKVKLDKEGEWRFIASFAGDAAHEPSTSNEVKASAKARCLIATAAFGTELDPHVQYLRGFRDNVVMKTFAGSSFMKVFNAWYYSWAPHVAQAELACEPLRQAVKYTIYPLIGILHVATGAYNLLAFSPEAGVVLAGLVASVLIGLAYLSPVALIIAALTRKTPSKKIIKAITLTLLTAIAGTGLSVIAQVSEAAMVFTSLLVLSNIALIVALMTRALSALRTSNAKPAHQRPIAAP